MDPKWRCISYWKMGIFHCQRVVSPVCLKHFGIPSLKLTAKAPETCPGLPPKTKRKSLPTITRSRCKHVQTCCSFQGVYKLVEVESFQFPPKKFVVLWVTTDLWPGPTFVQVGRVKKRHTWKLVLKKSGWWQQRFGKFVPRKSGEDESILTI